MNLTALVFALYAWVNNVLRKLVIAVLRQGPVPKHIAFIMDGNRRFATKQGLKRIYGHQQGYLKLLDALQWSLDLGVKAITVYAFSIDNFRRGAEEVEALMTLAEQKLLDLMKNQELINTHQVQVRILGDLSLLPDRVQQAAATVMAATCKHEGCYLNICMAYTSQQEMAQAVLKAHQMLAANSTCAEDVTVGFLEQQLYTQGCPPVDLLIRTSGEHRLSDFMLWQSQFALLVFSDTLWPDYSFWHLLQALVQFQRSHPQLRALAALKHKQMSPSDGRLKVKSTLLSSKEAEPNQAVGHVSKAKLGICVSDVDTSDSSVSSDSRPASRSTSPAHGTESKPIFTHQHQQQAQQLNQPERTELPYQELNGKGQQAAGSSWLAAGTEALQQPACLDSGQGKAGSRLSIDHQSNVDVTQVDTAPSQLQCTHEHQIDLPKGVAQMKQLHASVDCSSSMLLRKCRGHLL